MPFDQVDKDYKENPSIDNYLKLRKKYPNHDIEVGIIGGIDDLFFMEKEVKKFGMDGMLLAGVMDADPQSIDRVALIILRNLSKKKHLEAKGETHLVRRGKVMPDKLVDWLIKVSLDALSWNKFLHIPRSLIVLIRERLGGASSAYKTASEAHHNKMNAEMIAGQLLAQGITPTYQLVGEFFDASASTVMRWFKKGEFEEASKYWEKKFSNPEYPSIKQQKGYNFTELHYTRMVTTILLSKGVPPTSRLVAKALGVSTRKIDRIFKDSDVLADASKAASSVPEDMSLYKIVPIIHQSLRKN